MQTLHATRSKWPVLLFSPVCFLLPPSFLAVTTAVPVAYAQTTASRPVPFLGTVQSINGSAIIVKNDAGAMMQVNVQDGARLLRVEPGQTNLQNASPFALSDLQVGDRVLARGSVGPDGKQLSAVMLIAIKKADIAQKQAQEKADWQRGVGGLVKSVDPATGTIVLSTAGGRRIVTVQVTKTTIIRRYAPGSVKFDDAKPAALSDTKPGDQLRARGDKSADGTSLKAEEIVSGSFQNIAGTVVSADASQNTLTVNDLATKHPMVVHLTPDTQIKKLDPEIAQRIALRLKGGQNGGGSAAGPQEREARPGAGPGGGEGTGQGGPFGDPSQLIARAPNATLADFSKGSAVMLVAMEGTAPGSELAVSIVGGVEPMLQASASGSQEFLSSAWSLGDGSGNMPQ